MNVIMNDMNVNNYSYLILNFDKQVKCHNLFSFELRIIFYKNIGTRKKFKDDFGFVLQINLTCQIRNTL